MARANKAIQGIRRENRVGEMRRVICATEEPYHMMAVMQDGAENTFPDAMGLSVFLQTLKTVFHDAVLDSRTKSSPDQIADKLLLYLERHYSEGILWLPRFSLVICAVRKEDVAKQEGHVLSYFISGPDVALLLSNSESPLVDNQASAVYRQIHSLFRAGVRLKPEERARFVARFESYVRQINEEYTWWHERDTGLRGVLGSVRFVDGDDEVALVSKDVMSVISDPRWAMKFKCSSVAEFFDTLHTNEREMVFLNEMANTAMPDLIPLGERDTAEVVVYLPYL